MSFSFLQHAAYYSGHKVPPQVVSAGTIPRAMMLSLLMMLASTLLPILVAICTRSHHLAVNTWIRVQNALCTTYVAMRLLEVRSHEVSSSH